MSTIIKFENLWKEYRLGVIGHGTLSRDLQSWWAGVRGKEDPNRKICMPNDDLKQIEGDRFWALKNVNFEVKHGEILGIIGKNGAGKSTLLKILSRVTAPTKGCIKVKGRIASLLEVGTGFHPELTGRENIFLNGAILGMSKEEISFKLDEIVNFSGVEDFLDTPVKRYSSGMYVRLAFAVAAHLEPEILVVDEVLAVGDAEFQKKCLGKMSDISKGGRTVLFVSHNMGAISRLCSRGLYLEGGKIKTFGDTLSVVNDYLHGDSNKFNEKNWTKDKAPGNDNVKLRSLKIKNSKDELSNTLEIDEQIHIEVELEIETSYPNFGVSALVRNAQGEAIIHSSSLVGVPSGVKTGNWIYRVIIPPHLLNIGSYHVSISSDVPNQQIIFNVQNILGFEVVSKYQISAIYRPEVWKGVLSPESVGWEVQELNQASLGVFSSEE